MTSREEDNIVLRKDFSQLTLLCSTSTVVVHTSSGFSTETAGVLSSKLLFSWANFLAVSVKKSPCMLQAGRVQGCEGPVVFAQAGGTLEVTDHTHHVSGGPRPSAMSWRQQVAGGPFLIAMTMEEMPLTCRHQIHGSPGRVHRHLASLRAGHVTASASGTMSKCTLGWQMAGRPAFMDATSTLQPSALKT